MKIDSDLHRILNKKGYKVVKTIDKDEFNRVNSILIDKKNKKYFMKATNNPNSYAYKSLWQEANISFFLSNKLNLNPVRYKGFSIALPKVKEIIKQGEILIFISEFVRGKTFSNANISKGVDTLIAAVNLVSKIDFVTEKELRTLNFKKYTKLPLTLMSSLRFAKALINSKGEFVKLIKIYLKTFAILLYPNTAYSVVHPDINITNIIKRGSKIYLTDWEEVGWGISCYNIATPLVLYNSYKDVVTKLNLVITNRVTKKLLRAVLAYRILVLFNQKIITNSIRYKRDVAILNNFFEMS